MVKIIKTMTCYCVFIYSLLLGLIDVDYYVYNSKIGDVESNINNKVYATEIKSGTYAKALKDCVLYKTDKMIDEFNEILFYIPETYFVIILEIVSENCLKVQYDRFVGYIKPGAVEVATFTPVVKYLSNITLDIKSSSGTKIWQYPTTKSNDYISLLAGTKNIIYIASTKGIIPSGGKSDVWYYIQYVPDDNSTNVYEGYIYSENTINLSPIVFNLETNPEVISDEWKNEDMIFISSTIKTIIITVITIPIILFVLIILYKMIKKFKKNTKYKQNLDFDSIESGDNNLKKENIKTIEKFKNLKLVKNKNLETNFYNFDDDDLL